MNKEISKLRKILAVAGTIVMGLSFLHAAPENIDKVAIKMAKQIPDCPARFITGSLLASDGTLWVIGEHSGIYKLDPEGGYSGAWFDANYYEGYPETTSFYGIAEDKQGRIWVGTDTMGVVVFNGVSWKRYDRSNGLAGERIFDIAVSHKSGEVAVATSGGVTIYNPADENWASYTRADGLVEDQVECLAFDTDGNLWVGYQCGGIAVAAPSNKYGSWKTTQAPWFWDNKQYVRQPAGPKGNGLPSNLCNTLMIGGSGTIWLGTNSGLAYHNGKSDWKYIRGEDFRDKNDNVYGGKVTTRGNAGKNDLLPEDYVTCVAESVDGLWVGTWRNGAACLDGKSLNVKNRYKAKGAARNWDVVFSNRMTSLVPFPDGTVWGTTYGAGCVLVNQGKGEWELTKNRRADDLVHPRPLSAPTEEQLVADSERLKRLNKSIKKSPVLFWKDDWSTRGNWCGRYGANYAMLCSANAPWCDEVYSFPGPYDVAGAIGPKRTKNDFLRHWVETIDDKYNNRILYCPTDATRCQSVWDDHGEAYPMSYDGPDVWAIVHIPEGKHIVSLYFYNSNGQVRLAACRDYIVEVRKHRFIIPDMLLMDRFNWKKNKVSEGIFSGKREEEMGRALSAPVLARTRVKDTTGGGVYKKFLIDGPGFYFFRVCRNYSYNAEISGIFVERADKYHPDNKLANRGHDDFIGVYPAKSAIDVPDQGCVKDILSAVDTCNFNTGAELSCYEQASLNLYRYALAGDNRRIVDVMRWNLDEWSEERKKQFDETMKKSWDHKQEKWPEYRSAQFMPNAPGVIPFTIDEVEAMRRLKIDWKQYLPTNFKDRVPSDQDIKGILASEIKRHEMAMKQKSEELKKYGKFLLPNTKRKTQ